MPLFNFSEECLFRADNLSWVMATLIIFVIANTSIYSSRYMAGDRNKGRHHLAILLLGPSVLVMVFANHLVFLLAGWAASNLLLVSLMVHKAEWAAARQSGLHVLRTFGLGVLLLAAGFWLLADGTGTPYIHAINLTSGNLSTKAIAGLLLIAIAAMTQSAAWPFHKWLMSSLNSPTPVSALMHAGLVNGGGFLLVRFAPIYLTQPLLLHFLFLSGLVSAVVGTFWKLLQPSVKRMLACSTMGQMGFMLMQCGMGLFAPAVSHLCWHGIFKAYLFLSSGSAVHENRPLPISSNGNYLRFPVACVAGLLGAWAFAETSGIGISLENTSFVTTVLAFISATQLALRLLDSPLTIAKQVFTPLVGLCSGAMYGVGVLLIEKELEFQSASQAQPLDVLYLAGIGVVVLVWLIMNTNLAVWLQSQPGWKRLYMYALNASQPLPKTITTTRNAYQK